jgi:glyceraldehyde 3-phosphate dehydrogenase
MTIQPVRVGINGFGRIGRCAARILDGQSEFELVAVNDIANDIANLAYLYNFDTNYGRAANRAEVNDTKDRVSIGGRDIAFYSQADLKDVPWDKHGVDVVLDSSGVRQNVASAQALCRSGRIAKAIVTHLPDGDIDHCIIAGINEDSYIPERHHVVSVSICDANAIAHPLKALDDSLGIVGGFVTTLHPWLSYQNLVDSTTRSQSHPGLVWTDYSLGRASVGSLIPKSTTAITALGAVLPGIAARLTGFSYRVPTQIVCSADLSLQVARPTTTDEVDDILARYCENSAYAHTNQESCISLDYCGEPWSVIIDRQWTRAQGVLVKLVIWYDNEWGYSSRVVDMARLVVNGARAAT